MLPEDPKDRKKLPIATGVLDYFPRALAAVADVSRVGNDQHNPGQPLHWDKSKSTDHADCLVRHLLERGAVDTDGLRHTAKVVWRALALLETELEKAEADRAWSAASSQRDEDSAVEAAAQATTPVAWMSGMYWPGLYDTAVCVDVEHHPACLCPGCNTPPKSIVYIAGPMRGIPGFNFPAFDAAKALFESKGWLVISPADIDREHGDEKLTPEEAETHAVQQRMVRRDVDAILSLDPARGDAVAMLPGWENSRGAAAEFFVARWLGLKVYDAEDGVLLDKSAGWDLSLAADDYLASQESA